MIDLFALDKFVVGVIIAYFSNPVNMISGLVGALIAANVYEKSTKKKGRK
ncbi:hypothetical protein [Clostridium sp. BSD9I1]|nr:hypothetical protein [Clostridium sp. BSD9I1]